VKRTLRKDGKSYTVTYDEYGVVDTVDRGGVCLSTKNRVVQQILKNADLIRSGLIPPGFERGEQ
jgi:hypothetical protein